MKDIEELNTDLASACVGNDYTRVVQLLKAGA